LKAQKYLKSKGGQEFVGGKEEYDEIMKEIDHEITPD